MTQKTLTNRHKKQKMNTNYPKGSRKYSQKNKNHRNNVT